MHPKISKAITKLMLEKPFFGLSSTKVELKQNNKIKGIAYYNDTLEYNSEYLDALNIDEVSSIIANASLQLVLHHSDRGINKKSNIWQLASDYAINSLLIENGFKLHPLSNYSEQFHNLSTEDIYHILIDELDEKDTQEDSAEKNKKSKYTNKEIEQFIEQVTSKLEKSGEIPTNLDRVVEVTKKNRISWKELLFNYINYHAKIDYSMYPSNKKHLYRGVALPSISSSELKIAIAIDSSASINSNELNTFFTEIEYIMQNFLNYEIELIECDYKIQNITRITPLEPIHKKVKGGGSTDFRPVFKYLENLNEDFKFLIYFSDGDGILPQTPPTIETLWVLPKVNNNITFGNTIYLYNKL